jgi:hypothetical protein
VPRRPEEPAIATVRDVHEVLGYVAILANAVVGLLALVAWRVGRLRGRWLWVVTIVAEVLILLQVVFGVVLVAGYDIQPPRIHMFYGFLVFLTVGLAFQYRDAMKGRTELLYGLVGLFIMGLGIRAVLQVTT